MQHTGSTPFWVVFGVFSVCTVADHSPVEQQSAGSTYCMARSTLIYQPVNVKLGKQHTGSTPCYAASSILFLHWLVTHLWRSSIHAACHMTNNSTFEKTFNLTEKHSTYMQKIQLHFKTIQHGKNKSTCLCLYLSDRYWRMHVKVFLQV